MRDRIAAQKDGKPTGSARWSSQAGVTLIELIIVVTIMGIMAAAAVPVLKFQVKRQRERELRADLWQMRRAIDAYKDAADLGGIQVKADSNGYPPDLRDAGDGGRYPRQARPVFARDTD